jgi:predicted nicotinamide N-methyase
MLFLTGTSWPDFDFSGKKSNGFNINGKRLLLADISTIEGNHAVRTAETIWDGSIILSWFLAKQKESLHLDGAKVIEIGAGRGIAGLVAGLLGAEVTITDLPDAVPAIQKSILLNNLSHCVAVPLDWKSPDCDTKFKYIIAADVVWIPDLIEPLVNTIDKLLQKETIMYLCHQTRSALADRILFELLAERGLQYLKVDNQQLDCYYQKPNINIYRIVR